MIQKKNSATVARGAKPVSHAQTVSHAKKSPYPLSMTTDEIIEDGIVKYGAAMKRLADR